MTSTSLWDIKEGIQTTLRGNVTLVAAIRRDWIKIGLPAGARFEGLVYPCLFITNAPRLETMKPFNAPQNDAIAGFKNYITLQIIIMAREKSAEKVEESLDTLQKYVLDALRQDIHVGVDTVEECIATSIENFRIGSLRGQPLDGRVITLSIVETS